MRAMTAASKSDSSVSHLILDCKSVNGTDMTGCEAIESLAISLEKRKKSLVLANLKAPLTQAANSWAAILKRPTCTRYAHSVLVGTS